MILCQLPIQSLFIFIIWKKSDLHIFQNIFFCFSVCASHLGSCDIYSLPEVKGQAPKAGEVPTYVNTQHIDTQVLAALQGESETASDSGTTGPAKDSPRKDLFDMSKSLQWILSSQCCDNVRFTAPSIGGALTCSS